MSCQSQKRGLTGKHILVTVIFSNDQRFSVLIIAVSALKIVEFLLSYNTDHGCFSSETVIFIEIHAMCINYQFWKNLKNLFASLNQSGVSIIIAENIKDVNREEFPFQFQSRFFCHHFSIECFLVAALRKYSIGTIVLRRKLRPRGANASWKLSHCLSISFSSLCSTKKIRDLLLRDYFFKTEMDKTKWNWDAEMIILELNSIFFQFP